MKVKVSEISNLLCRHISTIYQEFSQGTVKFLKSDWSVKKEYRAYNSLICLSHSPIARTAYNNTQGRS
uniref:hypothetical protein n=1 Tax=uncultured Brachyspira sp. TaxID=221953 RepID=UPI0026095BFD